MEKEKQKLRECCWNCSHYDPFPHICIRANEFKRTRIDEMTSYNHQEEVLVCDEYEED